MICEFCEGTTKSKKVKRQHWFKSRLYLVENVKAEVCTECGERYFYAKTLDEIDKLLGHKHEIKRLINVEVVCL